jgi:hypothetical protein
MEATLETVLEEDRPIVKNVVQVLQSLQTPSLFTNWTCHVGKGHYIITAFFVDKDWDLSHRELELLYDVNPLRIISVIMHHQFQRLSLKIKISDRNSPIILTETQLVSIKKRSRWSL